MDINLIAVKNFFEQIIKNRDLLYIIQPCSIGDVLYAGGLSHAVQKRKNKMGTVLVVLERMRNLAITYQNLAGIVYLPSFMAGITQIYFHATGDYEGDNYIYGHIRKEGNDQIWDEDLNLLDQYKKNIFNIPLDTEFLPPIVQSISEENIAELNSKYILDKYRTIILFPHANTLKIFVANFWEKLVAELKARGYIVYTNTDGTSEKPIAGTEAISTNFRELAYIADKIKCFIGLRSGVFDFLAMTNAKILNINTFAKWWHCDLSVIFPKCNSRTFYDAVNYIKPIQNYLQQEKVNAGMVLSHPKINPEDIFYSYEDILKGILYDVEKM